MEFDQAVTLLNVAIIIIFLFICLLETTKNKKLISPPDEILIALHNDE
jgi:hypothetical protein